MKKADPFSGIPAVPTSLAGQWLAFNHMANHYRKLLNVKPRVDTSAPRNPSSPLGKVTSLASFLKQGTTGPPKKLTQGIKKSDSSKKALTKTKVTTCIQDYPVSTGDTDSLSIDSASRTPSTNKKRLTNKSIKPTSYLSNAPSEYQIVFGPSSIKSSTEAMGSDCESQPDRPKVELMGVAEKIKVFLDQLHQNDTRLLSPSKKVTKKVVKKEKPRLREVDVGESKPINTTSMNLRPSRHSKCFLPTETSAPSTPKKVASSKKKHGVSNISTTTTTATQYNTPSHKKSLSNAINTTKSRVDNKVSTSKSTVTQGESRGMKSILVNSSKQRYVSGGSIGSVGTIRGSDELTTDDMLIVPESNHEDEMMMSAYLRRSSRPVVASRPVISTNSKPHPLRSKTGVVIKSNKPRGSSAGYCSQSLSGKATSLSSLGIINHNDSSRDSAYGFSSGESRVPSTRESTPEKVRSSKPSCNKSRSKPGKSNGNKLKTPLSTIASSVNLDCISNRPTTDNHKSFTNRMRHQEFCRDEKANDDNEDKYLNFLSEVTQDIVNRGIYTNKGLKVLFQTHISNHLDLEYDKMHEMLEQLRSDLGIPKDDVLNRMEFGYGSVVPSNKSPPYSLKDSEKYELQSDCELEKTVHPYSSSTSRKEKNKILENDEKIGEIHQSRARHTSSRDAVQTKEKYMSKKAASIPSPSEDSLSETDIRLNLKEVGIDSETTLEIVQTIQKSRRRHHNAKVSEDSSADDHPTRLINNSSCSKNSPVSETATVRRKANSSLRSTSPSTASS